MSDLIEPQSQIYEFPNIIGLIQEDRQLRVIQHLLHASEVESGVEFEHFVNDVVAPNSGVLNVRAGVAIEAEGFLEIKYDNGGTRELEKKIPQGADGNLECNGVGFSRCQLRVPLDDLFLGFGFKHVQQVIRFDTLAFPSRHFNVRPLAVFIRDLDTKLFST